MRTWSSRRCLQLLAARNSGRRFGANGAFTTGVFTYGDVLYGGEGWMDGPTLLRESNKDTRLGV